MRHETGALLKECFILFAATNESFSIQTPETKRLISARVKYKRVRLRLDNGQKCRIF
jgi:hypothetical protein